MQTNSFLLIPIPQSPTKASSTSQPSQILQRSTNPNHRVSHTASQSPSRIEQKRALHYVTLQFNLSSRVAFTDSVQYPAPVTYASKRPTLRRIVAHKRFPTPQLSASQTEAPLRLYCAGHTGQSRSWPKGLMHAARASEVSAVS